MVDTFFFSCFSGLKPSLTKSVIVDIGVLKGIQVSICGMSCINPNNDTLKILGTHFYYNKKLEEEKQNLNCNSYPKSVENMENEKPYTRKKSLYFLNSVIKNYFPIIYKNCPKTYCERI